MLANFSMLRLSRGEPGWAHNFETLCLSRSEFASFDFLLMLRLEWANFVKLRFSRGELWMLADLLMRRNCLSRGEFARLAKLLMLNLTRRLLVVWANLLMLCLAGANFLKLCFSRCELRRLAELILLNLSRGQFGVLGPSALPRIRSADHFSSPTQGTCFPDGYAVRCVWGCEPINSQRLPFLKV